MKKALLLAPMGSVHRRFNQANISALLDLGFQVELVANFNNGDGPEIHNVTYAEKSIGCGIITHNISFKRHSLLGNIQCASLLRELIDKNKYDLIHAHTETGGLLLKLVGKTDAKKIYTPHGMSFWKGSSFKSQVIIQPLEKWICNAMDCNLAMNQEELDSFHKWNNKTAYFVHGVGLDVVRMQNATNDRANIRNEFEIKENEKLIVSIGELDDNKNQIVAIRALAKLNRQDYKYIICGVGSNKDKLLSEAKILGVDNRLILAGYRSDIPDILNAADIFVFPSFHEGMSVSALEAMACGLPLICSRIRGNVDIVTDGENGFLFKPSDALSLSNHINKLITDTSLRQKMGAINRERVEAYSFESVKKELVSVYKQYL